MEMKMNKVGGDPGVVCSQLSCQDPQVYLRKNIYLFLSIEFRTTWLAASKMEI